MAIWLIRAGSHGEFEQKFISENRVYVTWDGLDADLGKMKSREALAEKMTAINAGAKPKSIQNWTSQVWPFAHEIKKGDLVVTPLKTQPAIYIGEVTSDYQFDAKAKDPFYHWRDVKWIGEAIPRSSFNQDLLYSFGAFMTICRIKRNNAETRILAMRKKGWKAEGIGSAVAPEASLEEEADKVTDLETLAHDQIAQLISSRFKGHDFTRLIEAILKAKGYTTYFSPEGPDGGVDILAGAGELGFGSPRLCVEVKSGDDPIDRPTVDKLLGAVAKFGAQEGLFVSWSGFKNNVFKEMASSFFRVRLWTQKEILEALFANYDRLDEDVRAELPLKRIWTVTTPEEE